MANIRCFDTNLLHVMFRIVPEPQQLFAHWEARHDRFAVHTLVWMFFLLFSSLWWWSGLKNCGWIVIVVSVCCFLL
jgi:hypothetical protein